jgi:heme-degrading monooxygenase HmoA
MRERFVIASPVRLAARGPAERDGDLLLAVVTYARIRRGVRLRFTWHAWRVLRTLGGTPGLVLRANRVQPFGNEAWTLTVWRDESALQAFDTSPSHREAVARSRELLSHFQSQRFAVTRGELPIAWKRALSEL